ncbi:MULTISPECIES: bifunctional phosphoribosyl-AMP cyclohydrolase/phosphoribosyl-ATP diphosphatase HisIE [unclassified Apibacter]|uniref:bifunctional phosphoribosyl-AMP cyclohydrolase/phosphoribosyl-ATP diphosphatase HisIE n=1 Tax=unclassified Apibacter TaxID=2630820 RepID=UPI000CF855E5|nr:MULTISPECIES: bifunctional phosphoribosyl-AMP cyclohydrolase/phosphoribosyl-ATP diphosphatase HisIE [unclassified Apibacter]MXP06621.1 bifunctional phosphoribosyl-AMP cyclohydrolase/phosphoribosyl-ATP diphosphatase HisIE [Apibacter sp. B3546]MXP12846.1 bifunctional phosphoribosyl-AMP cyclohydrolase/phosphoribosyl-ATP diphosphatase HisIE [Apibacter sp. B3239]PQL92137.1 bifunctional phosphoribosyl-AMP cyclohydrolase/phosphoribosyl-ATP diphosphatase [Apibacter sp. wkB309]
MKLDFDKSNGLIPVIIQDELTLQVLMLGYMNEEAFEKTKREGKVTFFSRSKNRLWTKGETSHNYLWVKKIDIDCDHDTLLIKVSPEGPTCHTGSYSCFEEQNAKGFVYKLQNIISQRIDEKVNGSYTYQLYQKGINKVAQKVGEEAVEVVIEAKDTDDVLFKNEAADLLYHYLILLKAKGFQLEDIEKVLFDRNH